MFSLKFINNKLTQKTKDLCIGYVRSNFESLFCTIPHILLLICALYFQLEDTWITHRPEAFDISDDKKRMTRNEYKYCNYYRIFGTKTINTNIQKNFIFRWTLQIDTKNIPKEIYHWGYFIGLIDQCTLDESRHHQLHAINNCGAYIYHYPGSLYVRDSPIKFRVIDYIKAKDIIIIELHVGAVNEVIFYKNNELKYKILIKHGSNFRLFGSFRDIYTTATVTILGYEENVKSNE